jgi:hypothetical protein
MTKYSSFPFIVVVLISVHGLLRAELPSKSNVADTAEEFAKVQGKWFRTVATENGMVKVVKEHKGNETILTFYDPMGNVAAGKKSEFRLEKTGRVRIFTFFNNVVTAGPQKGLTDKEPQSYIFKVTDDSFFEVRGLLVGEEVDPVAITWKRLKE